MNPVLSWLVIFAVAALLAVGWWALERLPSALRVARRKHSMKAALRSRERNSA